MNRAREQAIRKGLAIVEGRQAAKTGAVQSRARAGTSKPISLDQGRLNISVRSKTSRLPWRGQFAPELVGYLIDTICFDSRTFLDPFCGSGTVLFEAVNRGRFAIGTEVNPAAWHLASLACFAGIPFDEKKAILHRLKSLATVSATSGEYLFSPLAESGSILDLIHGAKDEGFLARDFFRTPECAMIQALIMQPYRGARLQRFKF